MRSATLTLVATVLLSGSHPGGGRAICTPFSPPVEHHATGLSWSVRVCDLQAPTLRVGLRIHNPGRSDFSGQAYLTPRPVVSCGVCPGNDGRDVRDFALAAGETSPWPYLEWTMRRDEYTGRLWVCLWRPCPGETP